MSSYLRDCALSKKLIMLEGIREAETQLRRIGNNLNQLTRLANEGLIDTVDLSETKQEVARLWQWLNSFRGAAR